MPTPIVPPNFFSPILERDNPGFATFQTYLQKCDRERVAMDAMAKAKRDGKLRPLAFPEDRGFEEGHSWNRIATGHGTDRDIFLATSLLLEGVDQMVADCINRFPAGNNYRDLADTAGLRQALNETHDRIEAWLADPKQYQDPGELPRGTSFVDLTDAHFASQYLVQMNGWQDMQVLERDAQTDWHPAGGAWEASPLEDAPSEPFR